MRVAREAFGAFDAMMAHQSPQERELAWSEVEGWMCSFESAGGFEAPGSCRAVPGQERKLSKMNQLPLRIGVPARIQHPAEDRHSPHGHAYHFLEQTLAHWVMSRGAMLFMIPTLCEECQGTSQVPDHYNYADTLDGLILQGGPDIAPEVYGQAPEQVDWSGDQVHDAHQIQLFKQFLAAKKPILGICRGAQLINVALGGTLYQDIPSDLPSPGMHAQTSQGKVIHEIVWNAESSLARLFPGQTSGSVVSIHHQAIKDLGKDLCIEALSAEDQVIEAVRLKGSAYVVGLQWHPECHSGNPALLDCAPILDEFLAAARPRSEDF